MAEIIPSFPNELWKPIPGWDALYFVSSVGRVWSVRNKCVLRPRRHRDGHLEVNLFNAGVCCMMKVHRLVLMAFVEPPPSHTSVARHLNDVPDDNRLVNLAWGTPRDNTADSIANGGFLQAERSPRAKLSNAQVLEIVARRTAGEKGRALADEFGVSPATICQIFKRVSWKSVTPAPSR